MSDEINIDDEKNEGELFNFIKSNEPQASIPVDNNIETFGSNTRQKVERIESANSVWNEIPLEHLPFGKFYKPGTHISIRPLETKEIESFSVVNEKNDYDVKVKLNEVLAACVKIDNVDGSVGTYKDLMDGDRNTLSLLLAKATSKNIKTVSKEVSCDCGTKENTLIEILPKNFVKPELNKKVETFFNENTRVYDFKLKNGVEIKLAPPTIGLTNAVDAYVFKEASKNPKQLDLNISFIQNIAYILAGSGTKNIDIKKLEQEEYNYTKLDPDLFMFIDSAISKLKFGIKEVKKECKVCRKEIRSEFGFPNGARDLFIIPDAFEEFIG